MHPKKALRSQIQIHLCIQLLEAESVNVSKGKRERNETDLASLCFCIAFPVTLLPSIFLVIDPSAAMSWLHMVEMLVCFVFFGLRGGEHGVLVLELCDFFSHLR